MYKTLSIIDHMLGHKIASANAKGLNTYKLCFLTTINKIGN